MDLSKLTNGQKIALASGLVLIINLFLPWYRFDFGIGSVSANAFDAGFAAWFGSLLAIGGAVILAIEVFSGNSIDLGNLKGAQLALLLGAVGFILVLLRLLTETSNVFIGVFLGILATAGVTYGAFMVMKESGIAMPTADDFKSIAGGDEAKSDDPGDSPGPDAGR